VTDFIIEARAREGWLTQTFPKIPGDDREYVPLPLH